MTAISSERNSLRLPRAVSRPLDLWRSARELWGTARPALFIALPVVFCVLTAALIARAVRVEVMNRTIHALKSNHDVPVTTGAAPEVLLARVEFLLAHDRVDEIQPFVEALDKTGSDSLRATAHYDFANGRLRQGFDEISADRLEKAGPYVVLGRQEYRRALTLDPENWDAKFNLDVASRLVRDFPAFERTMGDEVKTPKKLWTDVPGKPEGLP